MTSFSASARFRPIFKADADVNSIQAVVQSRVCVSSFDSFNRISIATDFSIIAWSFLIFFKFALIQSSDQTFVGHLTFFGWHYENAFFCRHRKTLAIFALATIFLILATYIKLAKYKYKF